MTEPNGNDRISVSRDTLRAELAFLKLDLVQSLASKTEVDRLDARIAVIELHGSPALVSALGKLEAVSTRVDSLDGRTKTLEIGSAREGGGREWLWRVVIAAPGLAALAAFLHH